MQTNQEKENWWDIWFPYVEKITRETGSYYHPLAEKQDNTKGSGLWSSIEFEGGWWWQTIYDANLDHTPVITKRYARYVDAVEDFSIYPNPTKAGFAYQASFY
jgi:hypothetical protein